MIRILIIDDQKLVHERLRSLIELDEKIKVVGTAKDGQMGIELVKQLQPDIAIIDLTMPLKSGIETTNLIAQNYPKTKILIFTGSDGRMLNKAMLKGAKGYLLKNASREDLVAAIRAVERGNVYIGKGILDSVQLSSINSQESKIEHIKKIEHINLWLAKEVINWWSKHSSLEAPTKEQMIKGLGLDRSGLSWMKGYLGRQNNTNLTVTEELKLKVKQLFAQIKDSVNPDLELARRKQQIYNLLNLDNNTDSDSHLDYLTIVYNNFQLLQEVTLEKMRKFISSFWQQAAPISLLDCLKSVEKYLLKCIQSLNQKYESSTIKENSAWHSFDYLFVAKQDALPDKQKLCEKAVIFIGQCKVETEINKRLVEVISQIVREIRINVIILSKTSNLLLQCIKDLEQDLEQQDMLELTTLIPSFDQIQQEVLLEELRRDFEKSVGRSLNQWGSSESISNSEINNRLLEKLRPVAQKIYSNLREEALAVSFLKYPGILQ